MLEQALEFVPSGNGRSEGNTVRVLLSRLPDQCGELRLFSDADQFSFSEDDPLSAVLPDQAGKVFLKVSVVPLTSDRRGYNPEKSASFFASY